MENPTRVTRSCWTIVSEHFYPDRISQKGVINVGLSDHQMVVGRLDFTNYHNFEDINDAYSNFFQNVMGVLI